MQSPMPPGWGRSLCARYSRRRRTRCTRSARFTTSNQVLKARMRSRDSAASRSAVRATSSSALPGSPSRRAIAATRSPSTSSRSRSPPWSRSTSPTSPPSACTSSRSAVSFSGNCRLWRWITRWARPRARRSVVVVAARPVHVAVRDFLVRRLAHLLDLDREAERAARERVVAVHRHEVALDLDDRHEARALRPVRAHLHAGREGLAAAEAVARHDLHQALVARPVALLGRHGHLDLVAGGLARERLLEPGDDVALAVQVAERRAAGRGLDDVALFVAQGVMQRYDAVLLDVHGRPQLVAGAEC